jgi:hypothetical protein
MPFKSSDLSFEATLDHFEISSEALIFYIFKL